jgi:enterochelin esterase family protein
MMSYFRPGFMRLIPFFAGALAVGCLPLEEDLPSSDSGRSQQVDAGHADAGHADVGHSEERPADDGHPDVGLGDAGHADAELADAGLDGGAPPIDAGVDAGRDAGVDVGTEGDGDFTISTFTTQAELTDLGAPKGKSFSFTMDSTKSTIFDGSDKTLSPSKPRSLTRQISVYIPAKYVDGTPAPILVMQDGPGPMTEISRALDNLTTSTDPTRKVPPFIAIGVQNGGNDAQGSERGLEYDTLSDRYARFIQLEVLPAVLADARIKAAYPKLAFTDDPEGRATYGCSSGGVAAFTMAWFAPHLFRRVLSYSGTLVAQQNSGQPESPLYPLGAWEYHSSKQLIANSEVKPLRIFLNVNENDLGAADPESTHHNWVMANQRTAAALKVKGYHYRYVLAKGLGHCDSRALKATLADALVWLWRGYP